MFAAEVSNVSGQQLQPSPRSKVSNGVRDQQGSFRFRPSSHEGLPDSSISGGQTPPQLQLLNRRQEQGYHEESATSAVDYSPMANAAAFAAAAAAAAATGVGSSVVTSPLRSTVQSGAGGGDSFY